MSRITVTIPLLTSMVLAGCVAPPMGPTAMVMPAQGKPFAAFASDQAMCKQFADGEVAGGANAANLRQFGTMAVTTALGAGFGASVRGRRGAEFGGALGAIGGAAAAARGSARDQYSLQGRYDMAYTQCMYSRGNQVANGANAGPRTAQRRPSTQRGADEVTAAPRIAYGPTSTAYPPEPADWRDGPQGTGSRRGQGGPGGYDPNGPDIR